MGAPSMGQPPLMGTTLPWGAPPPLVDTPFLGDTLLWGTPPWVAPSLAEHPPLGATPSLWGTPCLGDPPRGWGGAKPAVFKRNALKKQ